VPLDELIGEAQFALVYAASLYDPGKDVPFGAYVTMVIRHRLLQAVTVWRRGGRLAHVRFTDLSACLPGEPGYFDPPCTRTAEAGEQAAVHELLDWIRRSMPARWFEVLTLYFAHDHSLQEIGDRLGISRQRVRQLLAKAIARAREYYQPEDAG
jgi:RNA polymerase sigma factor (sigma-70 family)